MQPQQHRKPRHMQKSRPNRGRDGAHKRITNRHVRRQAREALMEWRGPSD